MEKILKSNVSSYQKVNGRAFDNICKFGINIKRICLLSEEIFVMEGLNEAPSHSFPQVKY